MTPGDAHDDGAGHRDLLVTREPALRRCWQAVAFAATVGEEPVERELLGRRLVLCRSGAVVVVTVDGDDVRCVAEALGCVWVCLEPDPLLPLPTLPEWDDDEYRVIPVGELSVACSVAAYLDNNTDATHVAFVHAASFGADQDPSIPTSEVGRTATGLDITMITPVATTPGGTDDAERRSETEIVLPFVQISRMIYPGGDVHILFKACCPATDGRTIVMFSVLRNDARRTDAVPVADVVVYERRIEAEDAAMLALLPVPFPLDPHSLVHIRHDRPGIALRRAWRGLLDHAPAVNR